MTIHRLSYGGADRVAILLANGLAEAGIPIGVATLRSGGEGEGALLGLLDRRVYHSSAGPPMGSRHLELARGLLHIGRLITIARPSVVLASSNNMGLVSGLSAALRPRGCGPRYVMKTTNPVVRPFDESALRRSYRRRLYGFVFRKYERVLTLSEAERETLSLMYPDQSAKFEVVTNPYVTPEMLAVDEHEHSPGRSNLLTLARLMPQKRLDVLLAAFARLPHKHARLTIVGEGPERPRLQALARSLGIADRIEMPGFAEDVMPWLRRADLFVLSSDYEGLPAALIEALACNIPVVTTDCFDGARSLLAGASGCAVVRRDDVDALAEAIAVSLTETRPLTGLREIARAYGVEAGIASHIAALRPLLGSREAGATSS